MMTWPLLLCFIILVMLGVPLWCAMIASALFTILAYSNIPLAVVPQNLFSCLDSYSLLAVPLFVLAGEVMSASRITNRLVDFASKLVGHIRGGLGMVAVVASMIFAGVSGSAIADTSAIGSVLLPSMRKKGYPMGLATTLQACAGAMGPMFPPSIPMIIYGSITGFSIIKLFLGGLIPGMLIGLGLMLVTYLYARKYSGMAGEKRATLMEVVRSIKFAALALLMPIMILGGIISGLFTATEAGVVAVLYGLFIGLFVERSLKWRDIPDILQRAAQSTGMIMLILAAASVSGWILAREQTPAHLGQLFVQFKSPVASMLVLVTGVLVIGCFLEVLAALIMLAPIIHQLGGQLGLDPLHFAIVFMFALILGGVHPPIGGLLYVSCAIAKTSMDETLRYIPAYVGVMIVVVLLMVFFPQIVLIIPRLFLN